MAEQFTTVEVKDSVGKFVRTSVDFTYENGIRNAEAIFTQLVELLTVALALNPDAIFYLCKLAGARLQIETIGNLKEYLQNIIATVDAVPSEGDPGSINPIEDFSDLATANIALSEVTLAVSKGIDPTNSLQQFGLSISSFIKGKPGYESDHIQAKVTVGNISNFSRILGEYYLAASTLWATWWEEVNLVCSILDDYLKQRVDLKIVSTTIANVRSYLSELQSTLKDQTSVTQTAASRSGLLNLVSGQNVLEMAVASSDPRQKIIFHNGAGSLSFDGGETIGTTEVTVTTPSDLFTSAIQGRDYLVIPAGNMIGWYKIKNILTSTKLELESKILIMSQFSGNIGEGDGINLEFNFDLADPEFLGITLDPTSFSTSIGGTVINPNYFELTSASSVWTVDFTKYASPSLGVDVRVGFIEWLAHLEIALIPTADPKVWETGHTNLQLNSEIVKDGGSPLISGVDYFINYTDGIITFATVPATPTASFIYEEPHVIASIGTGTGSQVVFNLSTVDIKENSETVFIGTTPQIRGYHYTLRDEGSLPAHNWKVDFTVTASQPEIPIQAEFYFQLQNTETLDDTIDFDVIRGSIFEDDYQTMLDTLIIEVPSESIGVGDAYTRSFKFLHCPVLRHSVLIYLDGQPALESMFTLDYANGVVTFISAPADGVVITTKYSYFSVGTLPLPYVLSYLNELLVKVITTQTTQSKVNATNYAQAIIDGLDFFLTTFNSNIGQVPKDLKIDSIVSILEDQSLDRGSLFIQKGDLSSFYSLTYITASSKTQLLSNMSDASTLRNF